MEADKVCSPATINSRRLQRDNETIADFASAAAPLTLSFISDGAAILRSSTNFARRLRALAAWAAGFLAFFLVCAWIVAGANSFQACLAGETQDLDDASFIRAVADDVPVPTTLQCVGDFLDQNEPTILALAAIAIALFGFGVWSAGRRLQRSALALAAATDDSSRLRLRAQVGIAGVETDATEIFDDNRRGPHSVFISVKNFGMTAAQRVRIAAQFASEPPDSRGVSRMADTEASFTLFSGQAVTVALAPGEAAAGPLRGAYVVGQIRYADVYGQHWRTNFCWAAQGGAASMLRFVPYGPCNEAISET